MNLSNYFKILPFLFLFLLFSEAFAQESDAVLDINTPFQKGRWQTGLNGTISSFTTNRDTTSRDQFSNEYSIQFRTGRFIADRNLLGVFMGLQRSNTNSLLNQATETLNVGTFYRYFVSDQEIGSFYLQPGIFYSKFDETTTSNSTIVTPIDLRSNGNGFGFVIGVGYSYALNQSVIFDFGMNYNFSFLNIKTRDRLSEEIFRDSITQGGVEFAFGFNILLDEFFF